MYKTFVSYRLAIGSPQTLTALQMCFHPPPHPPPRPFTESGEQFTHNPRRRRHSVTFPPSTWTLHPCETDCILSYCFVAPWFFTRMLIWHFNKLCDRLCCAGIAPIRLAADPLAAPLSPPPLATIACSWQSTCVTITWTIHLCQHRWLFCSG